MQERRRAHRYCVWFPMRLIAGVNGEILAVSRNVSRKGLLMATAAKLEPGASVTLTFRCTPSDQTDHVVRGRIVRCEPNAEDPDGLWPYMVAVEFDEQVADLEPLLVEAEEVLAKARGPADDETK